ncbi:hypothetical protein PENVUL_c173G07205, partial [Penicillium vulpinum]
HSTRDRDRDYNYESPEQQHKSPEQQCLSPEDTPVYTPGVHYEPIPGLIPIIIDPDK